jgi:DNA polymerase-1
VGGRVRTLLIDADSLVYAAASNHEDATQWDPDVWTYEGDFEAARLQVDSDIRAMLERLKADRAVLALSSYQDPWRKKILPTYKSNRKNIRRPVLFKPLRAYCHERYDTFERPGLEGDDILGILLTAPEPPEPIEGQRIVCSIDKDMSTLPGLHYNWRKDPGTGEPLIIAVDEEFADRFHMTQALTGDTVDGYGGCPGVGKVKAAKLLAGLNTVAEMWPVIVNAYEKAGLNEEAALVQARVARICRASDFDFQERKVLLWNP